MKTLITLLITFLISISNFAQTGINYKAVIKDDLGNVVAGQPITVQFAILRGAGQTNQYTETHNPTTDANGIVIVNIGEGNTNDVFSDIDWGIDEHWLNVKVDIGSGLTDMGTTQFMAVPYALHALTSTDGYWNQDASTIYYNDGDIGIGTNAPLGKLGINHNSSISDPQLYLYETDNDFARITFKNNNGDNYWTIAAYNASSAKNDRMDFVNGEYGDVLSLKGDGKIGFGVSNPKVKFHFAADEWFLIGNDTIGIGSKFMYMPNKQAFRMGTLDSGASSDYWNDYYLGTYSFATGLNCRAQGFASTAMGRNTEASNSFAFATGFYTDAYGEYSTSMGFNTDATGEASTSMGRDSNASGDFSTAMGRGTTALGLNSTAMGLETIAVAESSTAIGKYNVPDVNGLFMVGNGTGTSTANRKNAFIIKEDGKIGVNTSTPLSLFEVSHPDGPPTSTNRANAFSLKNLSNGQSWQMYASSGNFLYLYSNGNFRGSFNGTSGAYVTASDRRVKKDITPLDNGTLQKVLQLNPVSYIMKDQNDTNRNLGLISQEVQEIFPSITHYVEESDLLTLSYTELIPILIKALQEQQEIIDGQNSKIETQNTKIESQATETAQQNTTIASLIQRMNALEASNN